MFKRIATWYVKRQQRKAALITDPYDPASKNYCLRWYREMWGRELTASERKLVLSNPPLLHNKLLGISYYLWDPEEI